MSREICKEKCLCTGCTACASICPKNCIEMKPDADGFLYPQINKTLCINCNLCEKTCPVNHSPKMYDVQKGFVARYPDLEVLDKCTSGGTCAAFADYTFSHDGVLFGVGYDEHMKVRHFWIEKDEKYRVAEMRGSKYVQSNLGDSYPTIKKLLGQGRFVCFIGTPCQVAGLQAYLKKNFENLLTVDVVCHGASSPLLFEKYVAYQGQKYNSKPVDIRFRNKTYGYHSGTMMIAYENGKKYYGSGRVDHMLKAYFAGACSRYSCYQCSFKGMKRCSDVTVFDSWHIEQLVPGQKDDDKGYTNIFVHTEKGAEALKKMSGCFEIWEADPDLMQQLDGVMIENNPKMASCRDVLINNVCVNGFYQAMQNHLHVTRKDCMLEKAKAIAYKMGLLKIVKK